MNNGMRGDPTLAIALLRQRRKSSSAFVVSCLLVIPLLLACAGCSLSGRSRSSFELVPGSSYMAASINWQVFSRDSELKRLLKADELERMLGQLGVSNDEVSEVVIFTDWQNTGGVSGSNGFIIRGSYKVGHVMERLKAQGWSESVYEKHRLLSNGAGNQWCAPLKSNSVVCGSKAGVEGSINAELDTRESFAANPSTSRMIGQLRKSKAPILIVAAFPQRVQDMADAALQVSTAVLDFVDLSALSGIINTLGYVRGFGCVVSHNGDHLPIEVVALMKDEKAAGLVSGALNAMQKLTLAVTKGNLSPGDRDELRKIESMSVDRDRDVLSIKAIMPIKDFK